MFPENGAHIDKEKCRLVVYTLGKDYQKAVTQSKNALSEKPQD